MSSPTTEELVKPLTPTEKAEIFTDAILESNLNNLLAVIHRDGGHHQDKVGTEQAVRDAMEIVVQFRERVTRMTDRIEELETENERQSLGLQAAYHLLMAATGPEDGPESWIETRGRWFDHFCADFKHRPIPEAHKGEL